MTDPLWPRDKWYNASLLAKPGESSRGDFPGTASSSPGATASAHVLFWTDRGTTPFGNLAIPSLVGNGPMALRPTLTDGLPLSWNTNRGDKETSSFFGAH